MQAGKLRHRITFQSKTATQDSFGEETITWGTFATVWGAVEPMTGREFLEGKGLEAEVTTRIRIRYKSGILPEMRAVYGSHTYDVVSVIHLEERQREMHVMCREIL